MKVHIYIDPAAVPQFYRARSVPFAHREKVEQALDHLMEKGTIDPVQFSQWATPTVPVVNTNGSIGICKDYKLTVKKVLRLAQ